MHLGQGPHNGMLASGNVIVPTYEAPHFDEDKRKAGKTALFVGILFDVILDPDTESILTKTELDKELPSKKWNPRASGTIIPPEIAFHLEHLWSQHLVSRGLFPLDLPDEIKAPGRFWEGASRTITVNAYERDPNARTACIKFHKCKCMVCEFDFTKTYGTIGKDYIHVHHLKPLSEIRKGYEPNPQLDLVPVCPNCHAMMHRKKPLPYSVSEMKSILRKSRQG